MKTKIAQLLITAFLLLLATAGSSLAFTDPLGPRALLEINYSYGSTDTTFVFDAGKSVDATGFKTGLSYRYNFEYGNNDFTSWSANPVSRYQYSKSGTKIILLEVRDKNGRIDRLTTQIEVHKSAQLSGRFSVDKTEGDLETEFNFYATMFTAGGESQRKFQFRWDFDGDGIYDTLYKPSPVETYIYPKVGSYVPALQVKDDAGNTLEIKGYHTDDKELGRISVSASREPQASVSVFPKNGEAGITIFSIDTSLSNDESGGSNFQVRYDFENDGSFDTNFSNNYKVTHVYNTGGKKEILVQIKSASGKTDSALASVEIYENNSAPIADLYITNNSQTGDYLSGVIGTEFTFSAQRSTDAEDSSNKLEARFDFDGDGSFDTVFSTQKIAKHVYLDTGFKDVTVEVKDTNGARSRMTRKINIVSNEAPKGYLKISPLSGSPATKFNFDISDIKDSQEQSYGIQTRIDYDGDGSFETDFSYSKFYTFTYNKVGQFKPLVQIKDKFGQLSEIRGMVTVYASNSPVAAFTTTPNSGNFNTLFYFDGSASSDEETATSKLRYRWDFDYTGVNDIIFDTGFSTNPKNTHQFSGATGERRIRLEVEDLEGNRTSTVKSIYLHWASSYLKELARRGIITGINGNFREDEAVTRAELTKMIVIAAKIQGAFNYAGYFNDVSISDWHWRYIEAAKEKGIVSGATNNTFQPSRSINRAEALKIILLAFKTPLQSSCNKNFSDIKSGDWFFSYVCTAANMGIVKGYDDGKFHPERPITRAEAAKIISLMISPN